MFQKGNTPSELQLEWAEEQHGSHMLTPLFY